MQAVLPPSSERRRPAGPRRHRWRRLAAVALVGLVVLTGCTRDRNPDEALRVGDLTVDTAQVEATAAPLVAGLADAGTTGLDGEIRRSVVQLMIIREVTRRYAQEKGITPGAPDYAGVAAQHQTGTDDPYVRLNAETAANLEAIRENSSPRPPTEDEMRDVFDRFVELVGPGPTYEAIRGELLGLEDYSRSLGMRDELLAAMDRYGLTVNPLYQPLDFALYTVQVNAPAGEFVLVSIPLGEQGTGAVRPAG
jgi:hypothetical protein